MRVSLDYDGTYTRDPDLWNAWINLAKERGHEVICVTMRYPHEEITPPCEVVYTSRKAKAEFMSALGRYPDIWIDDMPHFILESSA